MVDLTASQRQQVNSLHNISAPGPLNHRDASNSRWKNDPTPIAAPRNTRPGLASSPYDRMENTLRSCPAGNPIRRATLLTKPQRFRAEPKSSKPDLAFPKRLTAQMNNSRSATSTHTSSRRIGYPTVHTSDAQEQIVNPSCGNQSAPAHQGHSTNTEVVVISDEEDLGIPVPRSHTPHSRALRPRSSSSSDPMQLRGSEPPSGHRQHTDFRKSKQNNFALKPHAKTAAVTDIEDIEDFTSESGNIRPSTHRHLRSKPAATLTPSIRPGIVEERRGAYESNIPHYDLSKFLKNGVARNMKLRGATKPASLTSQSQLDNIATERTKFTSCPLTKELSLTLPLQAWAIGLKIFVAEECLEPPVFVYDPQNRYLNVSLPGRSHFYRFQQPDGFEGVTVTNDDDEPLKDNVVIQLSTKKDCRMHDNGYRILEFEPGSEHSSGHLTFFFSTDEAKGWTPTTYQTLISLLKKSASKPNTVRPTGGKSLWEKVQNEADMFQLRASRRKSTAQSIKNAFPAPTLHSSTVKSQMRLGSDVEPPNAEASSSAPLRRSSRQSAAAAAAAPPETMSESPPLADPEELILVYPPSGPGSLNLMGSDLNRLRPHEFLNDTLIEFGLKLWLNELREQNPDFADQVHVFSSFFYKKLNNKRSLDEGYQSVKKWTSKVDIFSKKYIIVPINENLHWYLAIIYEPEHTLHPPLPQKEASLSQRGKLRRKNVAEPDVHLVTHLEFPLTHDLTPPGERSEPDAEAASLHATCASTPSIMQDEAMDDISPVEFTQSCSISHYPPEELRSASSSKPVSMRSRSASVGKASGKSMFFGDFPINEIESIFSPPPCLESMDVDITVTDAEAISERTEFKDNISSSNSSTSTQVSEPPNALSSKPASRSIGIPSSRFYGTSTKGKQKADNLLVVPDSEEEDEGNEDEKQEKEVDAMLGVLPSQTTQTTNNDPPRTWIFTLDSLGSRHPQAQKVLRFWLQAEAKDKRQFDEVRTAECKLAQVPSQPNFADCGIYLLHFAKTFLSKPVHYFDLIYQTKKICPAEQRRSDWNETEVQYYRESLIQRITQLSAEWKATRAVKDEDTKRKRESEELGQAESESSELEVDIVEDIKVPRPTPKQRPAKRMRG